jgi:hypothetical protein
LAIGLWLLAKSQELTANSWNQIVEHDVENGPSFRRRRDVLQLLAAVLTPWIMLAVAFTPALVSRELYRSGWWVKTEPSGAVVMWLYVVAISGLFAGVGLFFFGVWRLIWFRDYRRSVYGWTWPLLMWFSTGGIGPATGH